MSLKQRADLPGNKWKRSHFVTQLLSNPSAFVCLGVIVSHFVIVTDVSCECILHGVFCRPHYVDPDFIE